MSTRPQGNDWWQASDGKWYPPELRHPPQPPPYLDRGFRTPEFSWSGVPDGEKWKVAWGVLWRIWVFSVGLWVALFFLFVIIALVAGE